MEVGVRETCGGGIWVVDELRVRFGDAFDEESVVGVDGPAQTDCRQVSVGSVTLVLVWFSHVPTYD